MTNAGPPFAAEPPVPPVAAIPPAPEVPPVVDPSPPPEQALKSMVEIAKHQRVHDMRSLLECEDEEIATKSETPLECQGRAVRHHSTAARSRFGGRPIAAKPQIVLLSGERGVGRTRLAMEFYRWLSEEIDAREPSGYWPDAAEFSKNEIIVNPPTRLCKFKNDIPYLWWGLHVRRDGIATFDDYLAPHMARLLLSTIRREAALKTVGVFAKFIADIGTSGLASLTYSILSAMVEESGVIRGASKDASVNAALDAPKISRR